MSLVSLNVIVFFFSNLQFLKVIKFINFGSLWFLQVSRFSKPLFVMVETVLRQERCSSESAMLIQSNIQKHL